MTWSPHITVAAIVERDQRFLVVEERVDDSIRFNQPAGHLEADETLLQAVVRETLEETAWQIEPTGFLGVYIWSPPGSELTYFRFAFVGDAIHHQPGRTLDQGIIAAHWLTHEQLLACQPQHRSPLVLRCVDDYLAGRRFPLDLMTYYP